jgi:hypothetical protein
LEQRGHSLDFHSAESLFRCMGSIRHRNGQSRYTNVGGSKCAEVTSRLLGDVGRRAEFLDLASPIPSCDIIAAAVEMMTGELPY